MNADEHLSRLDDYLRSRCETSFVEYKAAFDPSSNQDWCELLKDIIAIANSGGGLIVIGLNDEGEPVSCDVDKILAIDPADVSVKIEKYTASSYADFRIVEAKASESRLACIALGAAFIPIVFSKPGTYAVAGTAQQKTAFGQGTLYFRHGAKSEHANSTDLRAFVDREVDRVRDVWLANVRKVVEAPLGANVIISTEETGNPVLDAKRVRLTANKAAPEVRGLDPNQTHPHRQKEVVHLISNRLAGLKITGHDVFAVRKHHDLESRAEFCYKPRFSSALYSNAFIEWIVEQHNEDPAFFEKAKTAIKVMSEHADPQDERLNWLKEYMARTGLSISAAALEIKISGGTLSRLFSAKYKGDVERMLKRIAAFRDRCAN